MNNKILVIDDSRTNLIMLRHILENAGYDVITADSGKEALKKINEYQFHCILLDIEMPEMNGFDVINKLKQMPGICDIPVIFLSAREDEKDIIEGFEAGAVDYITKPYSSKIVGVRVKSQVKLYSTIKSLATAQADIIKQISNAQNELLKKPEDFKYANFSVYYQSLHAAGGDIYDIIKISDKKIGYFVGDFAGHQISTAFLTSSIKALLTQNCNNMTSPKESMSILNSVLCEIMKPGQYLTACYAELNTETNELTVVNMGHPPLVALLSHAKNEFMGRNGDLLGAFPDAFYQEDKIKLIGGDRLILYTDGLIEGDKVWSANTKILREKANLIKDKNRDDFIDSLLDATSASRSGADDDILLLVVDILGEPPVINKEENEKTLTVNFSSTKRLIPEVVKSIYDWVIDRNGKISRYGLKLVLHESLTNAVIHGNREEITKDVQVLIEIEEANLIITITDKGRGFDWKSELNKSRSVSATSGRGHSLFSAYEYSISYNDSGNQLILQKKLTDR